MNTFVKYCPNVFVAKCDEIHETGSEIIIHTRHGGELKHIVYKHLFERGGSHYHSVVRSDGFNSQERAKRKLQRIDTAASKAQIQSEKYYNASKEGSDFLALAEPIKIGHHSEKRHRALIERNQNRIEKFVEFANKADEIKSRAAYWEAKSVEINLSMPDSLEYFEFKVMEAIEHHKGLKDGSIPKSHSFSLTYAKKQVNELQKKLEIAKKLWQIE